MRPPEPLGAQHQLEGQVATATDPQSGQSPRLGTVCRGPSTSGTNGSQPQQSAEPTDPRLQAPQQPQPQDQTKGADAHG